MGVRLPSEYQEVEYLESNGDQYIDSGVIPNADLSFDVKFSVTSLTSPGYGNVFGSRYSGNNKEYQVTSYQGGNISVGTRMRVDLPINKINTASYDGDSTVTVNGNQMTFTGDKTTLEGNTYPIILFGISSRLVADQLQAGRIYYCRFGNVRNFIPCYRKADSKPGMYDLITKQFLVNQGTGEFLVGPDVIDSISPWLVARRRMLMRKPSLNTSPRIAEYNKRLVSSSGTQNATGMCYTEWIEANPTTFSGANPVIIFGGVIKDGNHIYQFEKYDGTFDYWYTSKAYLPSGTKRLRFTLDIATISSAYGYNKYSGQIYFAGPDTIYYGYTNINDMPQG